MQGLAPAEEAMDIFSILMYGVRSYLIITRSVVIRIAL